MDSRPPGSFVYGILEARILEWAAISSSRGSSGSVMVVELMVVEVIMMIIEIMVVEGSEIKTFSLL